VRRQVVGPAIRLDLDDPRRTKTRLVVADQARTEQVARSLGCVSGEEPAVEDRQAGLPG
jgi:hypothetical protein